MRISAYLDASIADRGRAMKNEAGLWPLVMAELLGATAVKRR